MKKVVLVIAALLVLICNVMAINYANNDRDHTYVNEINNGK